MSLPASKREMVFILTPERRIPLPRKRIEDRNAGPGNITDIAGDKGQTMHFGGCRQQAVDQRQRIRNAEHRPGFGDRFVNRQDAISQPCSHLYEPPVKSVSLFRIISPLQFDATAEFGENHDTCADLLHGRARNPTRNIGVGPVTLSDLRNDVGV